MTIVPTKSECSKLNARVNSTTSLPTTLNVSVFLTAWTETISRRLGTRLPTGRRLIL